MLFLPKTLTFFVMGIQMCKYATTRSLFVDRDRLFGSDANSLPEMQTT